MIDDFYAYIKTVLVRHKGTVDLNVEDADEDAQNDQDFMAEEIEKGDEAGAAQKKLARRAVWATAQSASAAFLDLFLARQRFSRWGWRDGPKTPI